MADLLVVDCSVVAKWVLDEPDRGPCLHIYDRYLAGEVALLAPDLLIAEIASLVSKRARRKQISAAFAKKIFRAVVEGSPVLFETRPLLAPALEISLQNQMSLWDSVYLALAAERNCPMVTADRRLARHRHPLLQLVK